MDGMLRFLKGDYLALGLVMVMAVGILGWVSVEFMGASDAAMEKITETLLVQTNK